MTNNPVINERGEFAPALVLHFNLETTARGPGSRDGSKRYGSGPNDNVCPDYNGRVPQHPPPCRGHAGFKSLN